MKTEIKKKLVKKWYKILQDTICFDIEEIEKNRRMLSEGIIDEGKFMDGLKSILGKAKEKLISIFNYLVEKIKQVADYAKKIIKGGVDKVLNYFELDVDVTVNPRVSFKV